MVKKEDGPQEVMAPISREVVEILLGDDPHYESQGGLDGGLFGLLEFDPLYQILFQLERYWILNRSLTGGEITLFLSGHAVGEKSGAGLHFSLPITEAKFRAVEDLWRKDAVHAMRTNERQKLLASAGLDDASLERRRHEVLLAAGLDDDSIKESKRKLFAGTYHTEDISDVGFCH